MQVLRTWNVQAWGIRAKIDTEVLAKGRAKERAKAKATNINATAAAAAIIVCESVNDRRHASRAPVGVALAASVNFDNDLDYYDDADDIAPRENMRSWLLDTGCKHDLTTRVAMPTCQHELIEHAKTIYLSTASDLVNGDKTVPQQIGELGEVAEPYVLDSYPDALSIGRRCVQKCFALCWEVYSLKPTSTKPTGLSSILYHEVVVLA